MVWIPKKKNILLPALCQILKKKVWKTSINIISRDELIEFHYLYKDLRRYPQKFFEYITTRFKTVFSY